MARYTKDDVSTRHERGSRYPVIYVKWNPSSKFSQTIEDYFFPTSHTIWNDEADLGPSRLANKVDDLLNTAIEYWAEQRREEFWYEFAPDLAHEIFGSRVEVYSAGRSGGWLIVKGLEDVENWDAIALGKWRSFEKKISDWIKYWNTEEGIESVIEDIEANRWAEPGAERYNFIEVNADEMKCVVDMKAAMNEAKQAFLAGKSK